MVGWIAAIAAVAAMLTPVAKRLFRSIGERRKADRYKSEKKARKTVIDINKRRKKRNKRKLK